MCSRRYGSTSTAIVILTLNIVISYISIGTISDILALTGHIPTACESPIVLLIKIYPCLNIATLALTILSFMKIVNINNERQSKLGSKAK